MMGCVIQGEHFRERDANLGLEGRMRACVCVVGGYVREQVFPG